MSFEFKRQESLQRGVRRIAGEEIGAVLELFAGKQRISVDRIAHESRKGLKQLRALLRLVHDSLGPKDRRILDGKLRDAGRVMSGVRDGKALVDTYDLLLKRVEIEPSDLTYQPLRGRLLANHRRALQTMKKEGWAKIIESLRDVKEKLGQVQLDGEDFAGLRGGLKRSYRAGRKCFAIARYDRDADTLHEWRKRVKDLRHHAELLNPIWPEVLEQFAGKAHELARCLGEDHDLFVLRQSILQQVEALAIPVNLEPLLESIDDHRRELQQKAMQLGERVYGEKPRDFLERMENYWNAWRSGVTGD